MLFLQVPLEPTIPLLEKWIVDCDERSKHEVETPLQEEIPNDLDLSEYLDTGEQSDVTIVVNKETRFCCHKMILKNASSYFRRLMSSDSKWEENRTSQVKIELHHLEEPHFDDFLRFAYGAGITITPENVWALISFSTRFLQDKLHLKCLKYFEKNLKISIRHSCQENRHPVTIPRYFSISEVIDIYNYFSLVDSQMKIGVKLLAAHNLLVRVQDIPDEVWLDLDFYLLMDMCKSNVMTMTEIDLFDKLLEWLDHDPVRTSYSDDLLSHVRYSILLQNIHNHEYDDELCSIQNNIYFAESEKMTALLSLAHYHRNFVIAKHSRLMANKVSSTIAEFLKPMYQSRQVHEEHVKECVEITQAM